MEGNKHAVILHYVCSNQAGKKCVCCHPFSDSSRAFMQEVMFRVKLQQLKQEGKAFLQQLFLLQMMQIQKIAQKGQTVPFGQFILFAK